MAPDKRNGPPQWAGLFRVGAFIRRYRHNMVHASDRHTVGSDRQFATRRSHGGHSPPSMAGMTPCKRANRSVRSKIHGPSLVHPDTVGARGVSVTVERTFAIVAFVNTQELERPRHAIVASAMSHGQLIGIVGPVIAHCVVQVR